jgi:glycine/D-amino acid oxidase-like deaminating enzyme
VAALSARGVTALPEGPDQGQVIHASGSHGLQELNRDLGKVVGSSIKGQAALLRHDAGPDAPQIFADGLHVVPHADGTTAIGSTSERDFTDPTATDAQLDAIIERARALMPELGAAPVIDRWAGLRPRSRSRAPMLGPHPLRPGCFIANGGFKIGFGMAPKIAETMADLVLENCDEVPDDFRVEASL